MPAIEAPIEFADFLRVDMRIGTVIEVKPNPEARKPSYILTIDFGMELGIKTSSAQLTKHYQPDDLLGKQVVGVVNFPPKRIAGIKSEVLVLGPVWGDNDVVVLTPTEPVPNGTRIG
jgi:tRNA-binding protein